MNNFFKHNDKVYSENLNDSVLVGNAFSWSISMDLPTDSDGLFPSSSDVVKAKVADVYATPNSNLSIGDTISNTSGSSQVYRLTVYPNFNRFGGFTFVSLEGDGSVIITEKGGTSPVRNNLDYANLGNVTELKTLREYDIVVTIPASGVVTGLGFGFQSSAASAEASISQANVTGLDDRLDEIESDINGMIDLVYPVGSIYMSVNSTSPATLFGGTWEQLKDKFLLASGDTYTAGNTGGEATHTLTTNEMPSHTHRQNSHTHTPSSEGRNWVPNTQSISRSRFSTSSSGNKYSLASDSENGWVWGETGSTTATNQNTGGGQAHNNMPPYLSVYMWKRTA